MSEYEHITDEELDAAIDALVDGSAQRQHGEAILQMYQQSHKRQERDRALLDAIGQAYLEQEGDKE